MYAGVNCYFLYTFPTSTQRQILSALKTAGVKTVRIFLTSFSQGGKGTNSLGSTDLELFTVGKYDDSILSQVDALMPLMVEYGLRLDVTMHDRWNLDNTWGKVVLRIQTIQSQWVMLGICDTYCQTYCNGGSNLQGFYNNAVAQSAFDNRLAYIATHINPSMGNRAWKDLPEAIFSFSIQNEAQGTSNGVSQFTNADWWCGRATALRKVIGASKVLIGTGGGQDWSASLVTNNFACANMEVIGIHSYDGSINSIQANLQQAVNLSNTYGKRIIFQEFGTTGNKGAWITQVATVANGLGVPWSPWEVSSNSISNDYEFGTDDSEAWTALTTYALAAHE
ncbi:glycoside hydrolase superfamily [Chytriomyces sp. MP71]|nr:glycoside hydrolase superfamily [Chytriomyces sp. MP71]